MGLLTNSKNAVKNLPSALSQLKKDVQKAHTGSRGTIDLGLSEFVGNLVKPVYAADQARSYQSGSNLWGNDVSISPTQQQATATALANAKTAMANKIAQQQAGGTGGSGSGNNAPSPAPDANASPDEYAQWAAVEEAKKRARMDAIIGRLKMMSEEADRQKGSAKETFDFTTNTLGETFAGLKDVSAKKRQSSLDALANEDIGVQNIYGREQGNARRAMESALGRNRMLHRAMGSLGSSFYADSQGDTTNQGANAINDLGSELADKQSGIKTRVSDTNTSFDVTDLELASEEKTLKNEALTKYNDAVAAADMLKRNYNIDSEEELQNAEAEFVSNLGKIQDYVQGKQQKIAEINALKEGKTTNINAYEAINPDLQSKLSNIASLNKAQSTIGNINSVGKAPVIADAGAASPSYFNNLKKKLQQDNTGYFINNPWA